MTLLKPKNFRSLIITPVLIGLIFTMLINGWQLLTGDREIFISYINIYNNKTIDSYPAYFEILFYTIGILQMIASLLFCYALITKEFVKDKQATYLKWALLLSIFSITVFGYMLRVTSNHSGAAFLFFYLVFLYFLLAFIEMQSSKHIHHIFDRIKLIPIYIVLFYTMGYPGYQKVFNSSEVIDGYVKLFQDSFLSKLPGGIPPFIYFLGTLEILVPTLLLISLFKKEHVKQKQPLFLDLSFLITIITFILLSFGLNVLLNYSGSTNLIFYAILTFGLYLYSTNQFKTKVEN